MKNFSLNLFLEINFTNLVFLVGKNDENNNIEVVPPRIIVVPVLRNVEETIAGIINRNEKGFKIPPVK